MDEDSVLAVDRANERAWNSTVLNPQASLAEAETALGLALEAGYAKGSADARLNIGWAMYYLSRLPESYSSFVEANRMYGELEDSRGICKALNALGVYHHAIFRLDKAIEYYNRSLELARASGISERELVAMANIGEVCLELGNNHEALKFLIPAYDRMPEDVPPERKADCLRNIGQAFLGMDNLVLAAEFTRKAYETAIKANKTIMATDSLEALANVAIATEDWATAGLLVAQGLELAARTGNLMQRANLLIVKATIFNNQGKPEEALAILPEAERLCQKINLKGKLFHVQEQLAKAYEALGNYKLSLFHFKQYSDFRAQVQHEDTANRLRSIQTQSEIERAQQEAEIYRLRNIDLKEKTEAMAEINRQIVSISNIGKRVTASLDLATVVQNIYDCLKPYIEIDMFGIALFDPARNQLVYKRYFEDGVRKMEHRINADSETSFAAWSFRQRKPVLISDKDSESAQYLDRPATRKGPPSQSIVCLPLTIEERAVGVMTLQNYKARAYTPNHLTFLEALAPYVSIAVENALIHDRLEDLNKALSDEKRRLERATLKISHLANHDTLTGLPNRRLLFELMGKSIDTARRANSKIGVLFIDLDDFKPINDEYGHAAGDGALVAISERLRGLVRASDIVARIGGDEFVAVVTNIKSRDDLEKVARKIIDEGARPLSFCGKSRCLGMSMGVSIFPDNSQSVEDLVNMADAAMYRVKHLDKNSYSFASEGD